MQLVLSKIGKSRLFLSHLDIVFSSFRSLWFYQITSLHCPWLLEHRSVTVSVALKSKKLSILEHREIIQHESKWAVMVKFYSDDPSSNPTRVHSFSPIKLVKKHESEVIGRHRYNEIQINRIIQFRSNSPLRLWPRYTGREHSASRLDQGPEREEPWLLLPVSRPEGDPRWAWKIPRKTQTLCFIYSIELRYS